ncbi:MAG: response regulator, partial [Deltaproteobacteria bacterium]|nr:response regulator [Deltaproteobacteria bacterium]
GLSVAYGIIKQHRGFISVYSEEGLGTTFRIYLPAEFNPREQQEENADDSESEGGSETILVAEDEASLLELLVKLLKGKGYKVITATNGEEAIERFKENKERIHLVLLDVMMPRLKGSEACQKIKEISPETPVIFSTGYSGNAIDKEFLEKFNAKLINKPYTPNVLYWMTRNALDEAAGKVKVGA